MRLLRSVILKLVVVCLSLGAIHPAHAQKLIGQVKTLPIVISKSGSYKLRSNIVVPDANTTAISVTADNVTIDLNGFTISGPVSCTGAPPSCSPTGAGDAISAIGSNATVLNGVVQGMGNDGIQLGMRGRVKDVRALGNGNRGIEVGQQGSVSGSTAAANSDAGIVTGPHSLITDSVIEGNGADPIGLPGSDGVTLLKAPDRLPITISAQGSYKLTSSIVVPDANTTAISVTADNVTIDLNGFSILGPTVCSGTPLSCTPTGSGNGIDSLSGNKAGTVVVNGTVQGMGRSGISLGPGARVEKVRAVSNGFRGIDVGHDSIVAASITLGNFDTGILTGGASIVSGSVAVGNNYGIGAEYSGTGLVAGNTAEENAYDAFEGGTAFIGNNAVSNGGFGLNPVLDQSGYANNVLIFNTWGAASHGTDMGHNDCNASTTCP